MINLIDYCPYCLNSLFYNKHIKIYYCTCYPSGDNIEEFSFQLNDKNKIIHVHFPYLKIKNKIYSLYQHYDVNFMLVKQCASNLEIQFDFNVEIQLSTVQATNLVERLLKLKHLL